MPTTRVSVCRSEIGQLWQKVEERGSETQISCISEYPGFSQFASISGCWRRPITRTGSSKAQRITPEKSKLNVFRFICFVTF